MLSSTQSVARVRLLRKYGLTPESYDAMLRGQGGVCKICKQPELRSSSSRSEGFDHLSVDHDHRTGQVRALLCVRCNRLVGMWENDFEKITKYLQATTQ